MTMAEFLELSAYWRDHPPTHLLMAAWLGVKPQPRATHGGDGLLRLLGVDPEQGGAMRL